MQKTSLAAISNCRGVPLPVGPVLTTAVIRPKFAGAEISAHGYPLDSGHPYRLCSDLRSLVQCWVNNQVVGSGADGERLLREAEEELTSAFRFSAVKAEGELIQVVVKVFPSV